MAKNQVTLTFAGDSKSLERTFDKVGSSASKMGDKTTDGFNRVGEAADTMDTRAMGFRDTMTGVEDTTRGFSEIAKGNLFDGVLLLGMGFGDLASGVANFGVQFVKTAANFIATQARMVVTHMANAARMAAGWLIAMGPIAIVIAAIAGIIAILAMLGVDFEDVKRIAGAAWEGIKNAASTAFNWLKKNWPTVLAILTGPFGLAVLAISRHKDTILGFFSSMPGKIRGFFSGMGDSLVSGFKSIWNNTIGGFGFTFGGFDPPGPGSIPGFSFRIPTMHTGGIVPGAPGQETLALLQAGERVTPAGMAGGGSVVIDMRGAIVADDRQFEQMVRKAFARMGAKGVAVTSRGRAFA